MRDNNTYTGDGDDLDLVTLEKINTEKKEKEIEREGGDKVGGKKKKKQESERKKTVKNLCEGEIDHINILINKCTEGGKEKKKRGRIVQTRRQKVRTTRWKTNRAAIVTNTAG